jgi:signal transduction histidine kinase
MEHKLQIGTSSRVEHVSQIATPDEKWAKGVRLEAVANLAHELRTPLQVLLGYLDALREEIATAPLARTRRIIDRMNANANELARIVENIMEFALPDEPDTSEQEVALFELLDEVMPAIEAANQEKKLKLHIQLETAPSLIRASHRPLRLILVNLAVNAIRFTPAGSVTIAIRAAGTPETPQIEIEVADTGPGLDPEVLERLFEPFKQLSGSSERRFRGMGLGLTVVKRNVATLGGTLELSSQPGRGSRFVVRVPVRHAVSRKRIAPATSQR